MVSLDHVLLRVRNIKNRRKIAKAFEHVFVAPNIGLELVILGLTKWPESGHASEFYDCVDPQSNRCDVYTT